LWEVCQREQFRTELQAVLALVIGLSVGAFFGFWKDAGLLKSYYSARRVTAPEELDDFSFMQYRYADAEHAQLWQAPALTGKIDPGDRR